MKGNHTKFRGLGCRSQISVKGMHSLTEFKFFKVGVHNGNTKMFRGTQSVVIILHKKKRSKVFTFLPSISDFSRCK